MNSLRNIAVRADVSERDCGPATPEKPGGNDPRSAQSGTITLHRFGPFLGTPDSSPFVIKVMMLLKLAGLRYREVQSNPFKAPKGLLPFIQDAEVTVADSTLIRFYLEKTYGVDFDAALSPAQKAAAWCVERMCEEHLYFAMLEARWLDRANFKNGLGRHMFGVIPWPIRPLAKLMLRRMNARRLRGHGLGRHSKTEIADLAIRDVDALAVLLGNQQYLMGGEPCGADATLFAFVTAILTPPLDTPLRAAMAAHANLVDYCERVTSRFFPDYAKLDLSY